MLIVAIIIVRFAMVARDFDTVVTAARFEAARADHTDLRAFLRRMPKGGDLHVHLSGAVYAERFIGWAAQEGLCVSLGNVLQTSPTCDQPGEARASQAMNDQQLYDRLVNAFSTRAYLPSAIVVVGGSDSTRLATLNP